MQKINFDVYGEQVSFKKLTVLKDNCEIQFIFDSASKEGVSFDAGLFSTKAVLSSEVFRFPRNRRLGILTESPIDYAYSKLETIIKRFPIVFTHQEHLLALGEPFKPLMLGTNWIGVRAEADTELILAEHQSKSQLVSFMGSLAHPNEGAYQFRREVADLCIDRKDVDCFGKGIKPVQGKREAIAPYYFSIAMENTANNYYFSEKLIDCLLLETVPIYYGCPGITELFNPKGLLIFNTKEELISILDNLSPSLYDEMYPYLIENKCKAVREKWHSHHGLLSRLSSQIPSSYLVSKKLFTHGELSLQHKINHKIRQLAENTLSK